MDFQSSLFADVVEAPRDAEVWREAEFERVQLSRGAWVDVCRNWLPHADEVVETLVRDVPWRAERREMYERTVDVPRLLHTYMGGETLPHPVLERARDALTDHYRDELREPFVSAGMCFYRDGRDSVAWHGDRIGRGSTHDTMVAIVSLGDARKLMLRPAGGGASVSFETGHGDLVVMGGSCQRTWEHCVPKTAHAGPRLSVQFRPLGVF